MKELTCVAIIDTYIFNPFNLIARCGESTLYFSNSSNPDQRAPTGAL